MTTMQPTGRHNADAPFSLKVLRTRIESEGVMSLELGTSHSRSLPPWDPGAHVDLHLPNGIVRQYSLCGRPEDQHVWRIAVLLEPVSRGGSSYIHTSVRPGDELLASGPRNNFPLVEADRYLFIAGGVGITPILPMLGKAVQIGRPWTLVYGGRSRGSMAFLPEIRRHGRGDVHIVPQDEVGHIDLPRFLGRQQPGTAVYCCGPGSLIDAVETACRIWPPAALHRERFAPREQSPAPADGSFEVELACSGRRLSVPADQSLLCALEDAGCRITNSCRAGICGTCLVRVLAGTPDHRDDLLNDDQRASGTMILPCVSRSKTQLLVLDI